LQTDLGFGLPEAWPYYAPLTVKKSLPGHVAPAAGSWDRSSRL